MTLQDCLEKDESISICVKCGLEYIIHSRYQHPTLCIDCSHGRHSYDRERRKKYYKKSQAKKKAAKQGGEKRMKRLYGPEDEIPEAPDAPDVEDDEDEDDDLLGDVPEDEE